MFCPIEYNFFAGKVNEQPLVGDIKRRSVKYFLLTQRYKPAIDAEINCFERKTRQSALKYDLLDKHQSRCCVEISQDCPTSQVHSQKRETAVLRC